MFDVAVIGGGIVGLATARAVLDAVPGRSVVVLEKEDRVAAHQSGRNSGVLHSGINYRPGSLKARTVAAGRQAMLAFCRGNGIDHEVCGKVIVATDPREVERLASLEQRAEAHGIAVERLDGSGLREREPHVTGLAALHVPSAGIVDFPAVARAIAAGLEAIGSQVRLSTPVVGVKPRARAVRVTTGRGDVEARVVVNCAGLYADRVARMHAPLAPPIAIVPFRGEYYDVVGPSRRLVRDLVYPAPDPGLPFLGVHFTRTIGGGLHAGPNAVLALSREGYRWRDVRRDDVMELARLAGMRALARRHWRTGLDELQRSLSKGAFVRALQRLVPEIGAADLVPAPAGVRAQAVDAAGHLLDDFVLRETPRVIDVLNAPSPAATASLEIGRTIAALAGERLR